MSSQAVVCPNCSASVSAANININALVAKCDGCGHVFSVPVGGVALPSAKAATASRVEPETEPPRPAGVIDQTGENGELFLRRNWFHPGLFYQLFFCIGWNAFMVLFYWLSKSNHANVGSTVFFGVIVVFGGVGVLIAYSTLTGFFNSTRILIHDGMLHVRHKPLPWWGNHDLPVADIGGIEMDLIYSQRHGASYTPQYSVSAHNLDGKQSVLLYSLNRKQGEYIGYKLAKSLGVLFTQNETLPDMHDVMKLIRK